jgi:hypothetical protein
MRSLSEQYLMLAAAAETANTRPPIAAAAGTAAHHYQRARTATLLCWSPDLLTSAARSIAASLAAES